jgi:hypothetical protein
MLCHLSALAGYFVAVGWIFGPLVVWLMKRNEMPFVDDQGKESLNFQITMLIVTVIIASLVAISFGLLLLHRVMPGGSAFFPIGISLLLLLLLVLFHVIYTIIGAVRASHGEYYRYPLTIRFFH